MVLLLCKTQTNSPTHSLIHSNYTSVDAGGIGPIRYQLGGDITKAAARAYGVLDEEAGLAYCELFIMPSNG